MKEKQEKRWETIKSERGRVTERNQTVQVELERGPRDYGVGVGQGGGGDDGLKGRMKRAALISQHVFTPK